MTIGTPGDQMSNTHWEDRFTCPECVTDHRLRVPQDQNRFIDCGCGAKLMCRVEWVPEAVCIIADPDDLFDEDEEQSA